MLYIGVGYLEWINIYLYVWLIKDQCGGDKLENFINVVVGYGIVVDGNIGVVNYQIFIIIVMCVIVGIGKINVDGFIKMVVWFELIVLNVVKFFWIFKIVLMVFWV